MGYDMFMAWVWRDMIVSLITFVMKEVLYDAVIAVVKTCHKHVMIEISQDKLW